MIVTEQQISEDLKFLAETDEQAAMAKRAVEAQEWLVKKYKAIEFLAASGNNEERKAKAEISEYVQRHMENHHNAVYDAAKLDNERKTRILRIDVWRSLNANRRQGNV